MHASASTAGIVQHVITAVDGSRSTAPTNVVADDGPQRLPRSASDGHTTRISRTKNTESAVVTTENGFRLATSIDGTLTGRGGDIVIIDDPLKPSDALSDSRREYVNN